MQQLEIIYPDLNDHIRFMCLGSGSSGNCYYLGYADNGILIDAGIGIRTIKKHLKDQHIALESIQAILITHDHADHIKAVGHLGEKHHIPVYSTTLVHEGINQSYCMTLKLNGSARIIEKEIPLQLGHYHITSFEVPHDGTDNVGYAIEVGGKRFVIATDIGEITPTAARYICRANYLVLEANYDEEMLRMGPYPQYLKERIAGKRGHLSNASAADFLAEHITEELKHVWLCHLSKDNNHPELAYKTIEYRLKSIGITIGKDIELTVLKRTTPSELYNL